MDAWKKLETTLIVPCLYWTFDSHDSSFEMISSKRVVRSDVGKLLAIYPPCGFAMHMRCCKPSVFSVNLLMLSVFRDASAKLWLTETSSLGLV